MGSVNKNKFIKKALITLCVSVPFLFWGLARADFSKSYVLCKNQKEVRTIRIDNANGKCQTIYTKSGKDQIVGSGLNPTSCEEFLSQIRKKLESANWKCRETKDTAVSNLGDETN